MSAGFAGGVLPTIPRVDELLSQMTLTEKVGQMTQHAFGIGNQEEWLAEIAVGKIGSLLNLPDRDERNRIQKIAVEQSRLGIPLIFGRDVIHGYKTIFPIPLGLAASFNPGLIEQAAAVAASEADEAGIDWTFAPMVDVSRDPRWGRVAESFGEDPHLASLMGAAMVHGFQGEDPRQTGRIAACAKHYVGYGAAEAGKDYNTTWIPEALLRDVYLPPFQACVEAGVLTLMSAFNDLNGVPASGNEFTVRQVLKHEWVFAGFVVSDWGSLSEMINHGFCSDSRDVAAAALRAGIDMEMATRAYLEQLPQLVEERRVALALVDDAVRRILTVKHRLGLVDEPYRAAPKTSIILCDSHRALARGVAQQCVVLLKNDNRALPLAKGLRSLAVVGPLADDPQNQIGCWACDGSADDSVTIMAALRAHFGSDVTLRYAQGLPDCRSTDTSGFDEAVRACEQSELTLLIVGEPANLSGEARSRAFIDLPGAQDKLIERLAQTGKPLVVVFMAGRPLTIGKTCTFATAALYAWHLGTMTGPAVVDLLVGDAVPSGKLPISFPRAVGQIPIYHSSKNTGRPPKQDFKGIPTGTAHDPVDFDASYLDVEVTPEFPFGFGLSYTTFEYKSLQVSPVSATLGESITVRAELTNTGELEAEEIVQLYVRDLVGSLTRPVRELKGFQRIRLAAGATATTTFTLRPRDLAFCGRDLRTAVEPGKFRAFVGGDSRAALSADFEVT
jgi:beta-glucosidase